MRNTSERLFLHMSMFGSVRFDHIALVRFDSMQAVYSVQLGLVRLGSVRLGSVQCSSAQFSSVQISSVQFSPYSPFSQSVGQSVSHSVSR